MIVAVQTELKDIVKGLKKKGYKVVDLYTYKSPIDAVVYTGGHFDFSLITEENTSTTMSTNSRSSYGVFIVCANGKSIDEIDYMLKSRCYSPFIPNSNNFLL